MDLQKVRKFAGLKPAPTPVREELDFSQLNEIVNDETLTEEQLQEGLFSGLKGMFSGMATNMSKGNQLGNWDDMVKKIEDARDAFVKMKTDFLGSKWVKNEISANPKAMDAVTKLFTARENAFETMIKDFKSDKDALGKEDNAVTAKANPNMAKTAKEKAKITDWIITEKGKTSAITPAMIDTKTGRTTGKLTVNFDGAAKPEVIDMVIKSEDGKGFMLRLDPQTYYTAELDSANKAFWDVAKELLKKLK